MLTVDQSKIRNFCIIVHIDHGKSTLADRIIEKTGLLTSREMQEQILDNMDLERERGITIKSQAVHIVCKAQDGSEYIFNPIDTPGHVDSNYEVSRSLTACDGAILVMDASQGIEAQTLANVYLALDHDLDAFPVTNKIDPPNAEPEWVVAEVEDVTGLDASDAPHILTKTGVNIEETLEAIVHKTPAPKGDPEASLKALIFDSIYDSYKGVTIFCRIMEGAVKRGIPIRMMATGSEEDVAGVGYFGAGQFTPCDELRVGMVGYITASIKSVRDTRVGDMVTSRDNPCASLLPGYKKVTPMVYCGLYPADGAKYNDLRDALEKFQLGDASLFYEPETSIVLGFGFRCGFLRLLHLEIIEERLEREYNLDLVIAAPDVVYRVHKTTSGMIELTNLSNLPDLTEVEYMEEPIVSAEIMVITELVGSIMTLCQERRDNYLGMEYIETTCALLKYELPLNETIYDFFGALKSRSRGYASFDYELKGYECPSLVELDTLVNREEVDAPSSIVHADSAYERGRKTCEKLKNEIPRHLLEVSIQAATGGKIITRETVKAVCKDVLAKCYGGNISRKRKLLEKQKEGKKRMHQIGSVEIPQKTFMSVPKLDGEQIGGINHEVTNLQRKPLELCLHAPFCAGKCLYCDFLSFRVLVSVHEAYTEQLIREIEVQGVRCREYQVKIVFIGGGTPSVMEPCFIGNIMQALNRNFDIAADAEITTEVNPGTLPQNKPHIHRAAEINRLSIDLQSADNQELKDLGRTHTSEEFLGSYQCARMAGFTSVNVDLMDSIPGQMLESQKNTLRKVTMLKPKRISAYSLIVEEGTPFWGRCGEREEEETGLKTDDVCFLRPRGGRHMEQAPVPGERAVLYPALPGEETENRIHHFTRTLLAKQGYGRYGISNYAKPGRECLHNTGYWREVPYLGLGLGSSSCMNGTRFSNERGLNTYLHPDFSEESGFSVFALLRDPVEELTREAQMEEFMFLGPRMTEGISEIDSVSMSGTKTEGIYGPIIEGFIVDGPLKRESVWISLTEWGMDVSNSVLSEFLL